MSNKALGQVPFSRKEPIPWRVIDAGLCLEGRCLNSNTQCPAHQRMVIGNCQTGQFIISSMHTFKCPSCGNNVRAAKFGVNRCRWRLLNTNQWYKVGHVYQTYNLSLNPMRVEILPAEDKEKTKAIGGDCTICLSPMDEKQRCSILPCQHLFHMTCIHQWIDAEEENSLQCPICRHPIFE